MKINKKPLFHLFIIFKFNSAKYIEQEKYYSIYSKFKKYQAGISEANRWFAVSNCKFI